MREFYKVTDKLRDILISDDNCNNVVLSSTINEIDINKQNIYPMAYIIIGDTDVQSNVLNMRFNVICFDIVDQLKNDLRDENDTFFGQDDLQDIWNTQLAVVNRLVNTLRRGDDTINYQLSSASDATPFKDRFENLLAGWSIDITITVPNTEICIDG